MKNLKKLVRQAMLLLVLFAGFGLFFGHSKALAATSYTATWVDRSTITVTGSDGTSASLTDSAWDANWDYTGSWTTSDGTCPIEISGFGGKQIVGLTQSDGTAGWDATASHARLTVQAKQGVDCVQVYDSNSDYPGSSFPIGNPDNAKKMLQWQDSSTIVPVGGDSSLTFSNPVLKPDGSNWFTRESEASASSCQDTLVVSADNSSAVLYELSSKSTDGSGVTRQKAPPTISSECYMVNTVDSLISLMNDSGNSKAANSNVPSGVSLPLGGTIPSSVTPTPPGGSGGSGSTDCGTVSNCVSNFQNGDSSACAFSGGWVLEWISCPLTSAIGKFSDSINNVVEGQLNFNVDSLLANQNCSVSGNCQILKAWTIFKDIVSGLVVLLLLVMVIAQAAGSQFLDAYTVKKMLPRLVIAVILMQFSFVIGRWLVSIVNDLGVGIKDLILLPFGGGGFMDLNSILHHLGGGYAAATNYPLLGLIGFLLFTFKGFIEPILIFVVVGLSAAVLTALATLLFRNIIIVAGVMFSPLALLLWATPGQTMQGYWRKYADNFLKALMLFPLVVVIIYTGRIVAWLAGGSGTPGLIDYIIVLIAYFGPYFILPKTFKWGGQLLSGVNQALVNNKALSGYKNWGYGVAKNKYQEEKGAAAARYSDNANKRGERFNRNSTFAKALNRLGAGRLLTDKEGQGRKKPWRQSRVDLLSAGMIFENEINRKKAAEIGEHWKGTTDKNLEELMKRGPERARKGELGAYSFMMDEDGNWDEREFAGGKNNRPGWDQYFAALTRDLFSGDRRRSEAAAKLLFTHPEFGIFSNNPLALDPKNNLWRKRLALEGEFGNEFGELGDYDVDHPNAGWQSFNNEFDRLSLMKDRGTISAVDDEKLKKMKLLSSLRHHTPYSKAERANMQKSINFIKATGGELLTNPDIDGVSFARAAQLLPTQTKATSTPELNQSLSNIKYEDIPTVMSRLSRNGWKPLTQILSDPAIEQRMAAAGLDQDNVVGVLSDPEIQRLLSAKGINPNDIVDTLTFDDTDTKNYGEGDQASPGRYAQYNESSWAAKTRNIKTAWRKGKFKFGLRSKNNVNEPTLMEGLTDLRWFTGAVIDRQDPTVSQVLTNILGVKSTANNFRAALAAVGGPAEISSLLHDYRGTQWETQAKNNVHEWLKIREALGIDPDDTGPVTDRDLRILEAVPTYQHYYPNADARFVRYVFDNFRDRNGRRNYPKDPSVFPPEFIEAISNPSHPDRGPGGAYEGYIPPNKPDRPTDDALGAMVHRMILSGELPSETIETVRDGWRLRITPSTEHRIEAAQAQVTGPPETPRWQQAQEALLSINPSQPPLTRPQQLAVERAHLVGQGDPGKDPTRLAGVGNYTVRQLWEKGKILQDAGFDQTQRRLLIERGIVGEENASSVNTEVTDSPVIQIDHSAATQAAAAAVARSVAVPQAMPGAAAISIPTPTLNLSTGASTPPPVINQTTIQQTVVQPAQTLAVKGGGEVSSGNLHPRYQPQQQGNADDRWRQQQNMESEMRRALGDALKPIAEAAKKGGASDLDASSVADQAARRIGGGNGPRQ